MEPVSLGVGIAGAISASISIGTALKKVIHHYRDAPDSYSFTVKQCAAVSGQLALLQRLMLNETWSKQLGSDGDTSDYFVTIIMNCAENLQELETCVGTIRLGLLDADGRSLTVKQKAKIVWKDDDIKTYLDRLGTSKEDIGRVLTILQAESMSRMETQMSQLKESMSNLSRSKTTKYRAVRVNGTGAGVGGRESSVIVVPSTYPGAPKEAAGSGVSLADIDLNSVVLTTTADETPSVMAQLNSAPIGRRPFAESIRSVVPNGVFGGQLKALMDMVEQDRSVLQRQLENAVSAHNGATERIAELERTCAVQKSQIEKLQSSDHVEQLRISELKCKYLDNHIQELEAKGSNIERAFDAKFAAYGKSRDLELKKCQKYHEEEKTAIRVRLNAHIQELKCDIDDLMKEKNHALKKCSTLEQAIKIAKNEQTELKANYQEELKCTTQNWEREVERLVRLSNIVETKHAESEKNLDLEMKKLKDENLKTMDKLNGELSESRRELMKVKEEYQKRISTIRLGHDIELKSLHEQVEQNEKDFVDRMRLLAEEKDREIIRCIGDTEKDMESRFEAFKLQQEVQHAKMLRQAEETMKVMKKDHQRNLDDLLADNSQVEKSLRNELESTVSESALKSRKLDEFQNQITKLELWLRQQEKTASIQESQILNLKDKLRQASKLIAESRDETWVEQQAKSDKIMEEFRHQMQNFQQETEGLMNQRMKMLSDGAYRRQQNLSSVVDLLDELDKEDNPQNTSPNTQQTNQKTSISSKSKEQIAVQGAPPTFGNRTSSTSTQESSKSYSSPPPKRDVLQQNVQHSTKQEVKTHIWTDTPPATPQPDSNQGISSTQVHSGPYFNQGQSKLEDGNNNLKHSQEAIAIGRPSSAGGIFHPTSTHVIHRSKSVSITEKEGNVAQSSQIKPQKSKLTNPSRARSKSRERSNSHPVPSVADSQRPRSIGPRQQDEEMRKKPAKIGWLTGKSRTRKREE